MQVAEIKVTKLERNFWCSVVLAILAMAMYLTYQDYAHPYVCVKTSSVTKIVSVQHRRSKVLLENGEERTLDQATLKPGKVCLLSARS